MPSTEPVLVIDGVCDATPVNRTGATGKSGAGAAAPRANSTACKTVVTKADFEKLLSAANPNGQPLQPNMRRGLAQRYVDLLTFSQAAHKAGIDKDPNFNEFMRLVRMGTLKQFYQQKVEKEYQTLPQAEVQAYYDQNVQKYEEIKLSRIFIPAKNPSAPTKDEDEWTKKASQEANDLHDRAVKGENPDALQKEAYTALGLTITPPATAMGVRRRGMMSHSEEEELFALKAGDVSKVEQQPAGYVIYKVESKETLPLAQVKDEISRQLTRQKIDSKVRAVTESVHASFNDKYFGPANAAPAVGTPVHSLPPGARLPAQPAGSGASGATPPPAAQGQAPSK
jgi:PPIC-type PPIASE domain